MAGLTDALKAASAKAAEDHLKVIRDRRIQYASDVYGYAQAYDNGIILAGYAAFFGLWAGVSADVSQAIRLGAAVLIGTSLVLYIAWHLMQMLTRQKFEFELADTFTFENDANRFNAAWEDISRRQGIAQQKTMRLWPLIFLPSVGLGFLGALVLIYGVAAPLLGLPA